MRLADELARRLSRLQRVVRTLLPPGQLEMVNVIPAGCDLAADRPPGIYFNADGRVAAVVFAGPDPDPTSSPRSGRGCRPGGC